MAEVPLHANVILRASGTDLDVAAARRITGMALPDAYARGDQVGKHGHAAHRARSFGQLFVTREHVAADEISDAIIELCGWYRSSRAGLIGVGVEEADVVVSLMETIPASSGLAISTTASRALYELELSLKIDVY